MNLLLYNIFLLVYHAAMKLAALWNPKAKAWVRGRKNWEPALKAAMAGKNSPVIWMHCASLGEFEQGRPILEKIRKEHPQYFILVSFFSPSGYEIRKNYPGADYTCYLPMDGYLAAKRFVQIAQPSLVLWIKYEFWYHYLTRLVATKIPVLLIAGLFRPDQLFFKWYGAVHRHMLTAFRHLFVQNQASADLLKTIGISQVTISGDTRYDRVSEIAANFTPLPEIEAFIGEQPVIVAGSTWNEDEEELGHYANSNSHIRFIIAPHEIAEEHIKEIEKLFHNSIRYSDYVKHINQKQNLNSQHVLIIDNIGMLSRLYRYADITYVGGGFGGDGLHNILEAAVYSKPVIHGPNFDRFPEAIDLIDAGGSFAVENALELESTLDKLLIQKESLRQSSEAAGRFVKERRGATQKILDYIYENRLLTS